MELKKLEIGPGRHPRSGYLHLDIVKFPHIEYVSPAWKIPIKNDELDEIYARHFFEHLTLQDAHITLDEWYRVLRKGGMVHIILPNLLFHAKQLISGSNIKHGMAGFYGWQNGEESWRHRWGYIPTTLCNIFAEHAFSHRDIIPCRECDIELKAYK